MDQLTDREQMIVDAVLEGVEKKMDHACAFDPKERKILHEFIDAVQKEGADGETHIIVLRIGNNIREFVQSVGKKIIWTLLIAGLVVLYFLVLRPLLLIK